MRTISRVPAQAQERGKPIIRALAIKTRRDLTAFIIEDGRLYFGTITTKKRHITSFSWRCR